MKKTLALLAIAAALLGTAFAQNTAAGTSIRNQASATYLGLTTPVTSNEVFTVVQQVYSFTITPNGTEAAPGQTRSALPGANVYFGYRITNTGNGTDTISLSTIQGTLDNFNLSAVTIYADGNCDSQLDVGAITVASVLVDRLGLATNFSCVVVESTIPLTATNGQYANLNLSGTSSGGSSDTNNWARAIATTAAVFDINKSATPSGQVSPGANIAYSITGQNRGGSAAAGTAGVVTVDTVASNGIFVEDNLPAGLTFVAGSLNASAGAGTLTKIYNTATGWTATEPAAASVTGVGILISGTGAFFPQNASYSMSFSATVPATATPADSYSNFAKIYFNDNGSPTAVDTSATSSSTLNTVAASYSLALGPNGYPAGNAPNDTYAAGAYTVTRNLDTQTVASVNTGTTVVFKQTLKNNGNTSDSFDLSLSSAPSGWTCQLVPSSGSGFISGSVGPLTAASTFDFQVHCAIGASATSASAQSITVTATSVASSSQTDSTTDTVSAVVSGYAVDLAQRGNTNDANAGNDNFGSQAANPSASLYYPIDVYNAGVSSDNYNMSASYPSGWSVVYYNDVDNSGTLNAGDTISTSTGLLTAGSTAHLIAVVTISGTAAPSTGNTVTFTATSSTLGTVTDSITASVDVNLVTGFVFDPDRNNTVTTPGTVTYSHSLRNNGNASSTVSIPAFTSAWGWTYQFSTDSGASWSSSVSGLALAANGGTATLLVRLQTPAGEPAGRIESALFTATANYGTASVTDSVTDTTTIIAGNLQLAKDWTVNGTNYFKGDGSDATTPPQVAPGNNITYRVVASNVGTYDLTNVKISDPLPSNTNFVSVSAVTSMTGTVLYSTDGTTWSATAPTALATGGSVYVGIDTNAPFANITSADTMSPAATITLTFVVQVK